MQAEASGAIEQAGALRRLLDEEFEALRVQDLDRFQKLQDLKSDLLSHLAHAVDACRRQVEQATPSHEVGASWEMFRQDMMACRELHRRNELLILRKRDAVRGALLALVGGDRGSGVEVYDRLGRVGRSQKMRAAYGDA
jgi:flagellar biosynthesis/type III secretory pathway chaperone